MISPEIIAAVKAKQTKELLAAHTASGGAFDLDKALASAQGRLLKAIELANAGEVIQFGSKACTFIVGDYWVEAPDSQFTDCACKAVVHCSCEDHKHRKNRCKHILAAGLFCRAEKAEKAEACNV